MQVIDIIDNWSSKNSMIFNHSKSGIFILNAKKGKTIIDSIRSYPIVYKYNYLGVTFTNNLSFQTHTDDLKTRLKKITKYTCRLNSMTVSLATKIQIFNNYVSSRIFYGMEIAVTRSSQLNAIGTMYTTNLKKVLVLKKSFNNDLLLKITYLKTLLYLNRQILQANQPSRHQDKTRK
jgi:hypothetical protein